MAMIINWFSMDTVPISFFTNIQIQMKMKMKMKMSRGFYRIKWSCASHVWCECRKNWSSWWWWNVKKENFYQQIKMMQTSNAKDKNRWWAFHLFSWNRKKVHLLDSNIKLINHLACVCVCVTKHRQTDLWLWC